MSANSNDAGDPDVRIERLTGALGARIEGLDLGGDLTQDQLTLVKDAFAEHLVLVFPDQALDAPAQIRFTEHFGPVEAHPLRPRPSVEGYPPVMILKNRPGQPGARNDYWHSDISHATQPPAVSLLHALEVPIGHGDTQFCNMYRAFEGLSEGLQSTLRPLRALHSAQQTLRRSQEHNDSRQIGATELKPPSSHPVVRTHPVTGRPALYVNPHFTTGLEGMLPEESQPLLEMLYEQSTRPENIYRHRWQPGDVVMWDNRCTMHYAVRDYDENMPRLMHRTTAGGEVPV